MTSEFTPIGSCACSRLLQTRFLGVHSVSIEGKVGKEAEEPGPGFPQDYHINTKPDDYKLMDQTIQSMRHCEAAAGGTKESQFVAILFEWQARFFTQRFLRSRECSNKHCCAKPVSVASPRHCDPRLNGTKQAALSSHTPPAGRGQVYEVYMTAQPTRRWLSQ